MLRTLSEGWRDLLGWAGFDYICEVDREGRYLDVSANYANLLKPSREELLGHSPFELDVLHPEDVPGIQAAMQPLFEGDHPVRFDYRVLDKTGAYRWFESTAMPFLTPAGDWRVLVISRDITRHREAEQAFAQESALLRDIIDFNPMSMQVLDKNGYTLKVNAAHTRLFNAVPPPDYTLFGDPLLHRQGLGPLLDRIRAGEAVVFPEFYHNPHDIYPEFPDSPVWIRMVAFPILGADGRMERFVLMHEDITERHRAELALKESEDRFRSLYLNTVDAIFWVGVDEAGTFRFEGSNPAHDAWYGLAAEALLGKEPRECLPEAEADRILQNYRRCLQAEGPVTYEEVLQRPSGAVHVQTLLVPIRDASGRIYRLVGTSRDITQIKQTEEILRHAQKLESLGVLAGGIAHDFNNLLTAILGNLNLAQMTLPPEAPAQPHLEAMERTVLKASELTRQMLAYSGKGRFVVDHQDLNTMVQEMAHLLQVSLSKKVALRMKLGEGLPCIRADAAQIQQVIMNLVTNASDAIGDNDGVITLLTRREELDAEYISRVFSAEVLAPGPYVCLEVSDSGCGIPPDLMARIFDPFFTTKTTGHGLGLSAMLGILRGHGGGVKIYSEVGRGTTFKVFLPAIEGEAKPSAGARPQGAEKLEGTVLVVDDELSILESLQAALRHFGLRVTLASDGQEALARFQENPQAYDLVLMDLTMPRMDGRETFLAMRALRPDVRVILSSGYNEQESVQNFLGRGLVGFIQKPYQLKELRRMLTTALGGARP